MYLSAATSDDVARLSPVLRRIADGDGAGVQAAPSVNPVPGDGTAARVARDAAGRVGVTVTARDVPPVARALAGLGFVESSQRPDLHLIEGYLPTAALRPAAGLGPVGLLGITPTYLAGSSVGKVTDEGDFAQFTNRVRAALPAGYDGTGVKVGIISDSFNVLGGAPADVASGDLPPDVQILHEGPSAAFDEGRAMAQVVHDLAPGASIAFAARENDPAGTGNQVRALADAGCTVIVDDVFFPIEPFYQASPLDQAIHDVAARGVVYVSAAGNDSDLAYESTQINFVPVGPNGDMMYDFDPGPGVDTRLSVTEDFGNDHAVSLQWDDPFYTQSGVKTDLDLIVSQNGTRLFGSTNDNVATRMPFEFVAITNNTSPQQPITFDLEIQLRAGPAPGRLKLLSQFEHIQFNEFATHSPTLYGHSASPDALTVAAVPWYDRAVPEDFTSLGPTTRLFAADGTRLAAPQVLNKPDVAAVDGTGNTFFGDADGTGRFKFFGTSAAAPHVAAIAALVRQAHPELTAAQVRDRIVAAADPSTNTPGYDPLTGAGLVDAYEAVFGPPVPALPALADGFEVGGLGRWWEARSTGAGQILVTADLGPAQGARHLTMGGSDGGPPSLNEVVLHVDASAADDGELKLTFRQREFDDADDPMPASFTGSGNYDGVAVSADGVTWYRLVSLTGADSTDTYRQQSFDLTAALAAAGLAPGPDLRIKFQQFGDKLVGAGGGMAFDDVTVALDAAAPARPDLLPESDSGVSDHDDLTNLNNWGPARALRFSVAGTPPGATLTLYADGVAIGTAVTTPGKTVVATDGTQWLADGVHTFTATLRAAGGAESPPSDGLAVTVDATAPSVTSVVASGLSWSAAFVDALGAISGGAAPMEPLPWSNVDRVELRFTEPVAVAAADLLVTGPGAAGGPPADFSPDSDGMAAAWTLGGPLVAGRYTLALAPAATDLAGNAVAGAWDGALAALPGDATGDGRVDAADLLAVRGRVRRSPSDVGPGPEQYDPYSDLNADGTIDVADLAIVRRNMGRVVPLPMTPAPAASASQPLLSPASRRGAWAELAGGV